MRGETEERELERQFLWKEHTHTHSHPNGNPSPKHDLLYKCSISFHLVSSHLVCLALVQGRQHKPISEMTSQQLRYLSTTARISLMVISDAKLSLSSPSSRFTPFSSPSYKPRALEMDAIAATVPLDATASWNDPSASTRSLMPSSLRTSSIYRRTSFTRPCVISSGSTGVLNINIH